MTLTVFYCFKGVKLCKEKSNIVKISSDTKLLGKYMMRDTVMFIYLTCRSLGNIMLIINLLCRKMPNLETTA